MSLSPGTRLGHYAVTVLRGEGGIDDDVSLRSMNRRQEPGGSRCSKDLALPDQQQYMPLKVGDRLGPY